MRLPFQRFFKASCVAPSRRKARSSKSRNPQRMSLELQSLEPRLAFAVADTLAPAINSIAALRPQTYGTGNAISFRVTFSEKIVVTGVPTLPIGIGDNVRQAAWDGKGSGGTSLVFTTTVQSGDFAPAGVYVAGPVGLAGGAAIRDTAGNRLIPTASGAFPGVTVDGVGPSMVDIRQVQVTPRLISLSVTFSEPVFVRGTPSIPFTLAGASKQLRYAAGSGTPTLVFSYRPAKGEAPTAANVNVPMQSIALNGGTITDNIRNVAASLAKPTDVQLSAPVVPENQPSGTVVGILSAVDADGSRDRHTYTLITGAGSTDNASFQIVGNELRTTGLFDFETKSSYSVRVKCTDQGGLSTEKVFTITVTNVNEAPTDIGLSATSINENAGANAVVGALSTTDPDVSSTFTYTLVAGVGDTDNTAFNIVGNQLRATASLNFETKSSYSIRVRSADGGSLSTEKALTITVTNVNEAPTDIGLSATSINENAGANAVIGVFTTTDPDAGNTFAYTLVTGSGDTDNAIFNISGNQLRATASLDFEKKSSYSVRVKGTDQGSLSTEKVFAITVANVDDFVIQFVRVGDAGNAADTDPVGYGAVEYEYLIGAYETTIGQYTEFLNAVATTDTYGLYNPYMGTDLNIAGISRSGSPGSYRYTVMNNGGDSSNRPIMYVSWFDAARFANWMHNGRIAGEQNATTTEDGAYTLNGATSGTAPAKNAGAKFYIPTENEWYKAAYYKGGSTNAGYWDYATRSDSAPGNTIGSGANQANYYAGDYAVTQSASYSSGQNYLTDVGAFTNSASYYGTFDQSGSGWEWNDLTGAADSSRGLRGGNWDYSEFSLSSPVRLPMNPYFEINFISFRLASPA
jgi:formylglycine-generating enzyme required for sulfatase activity